jgi:Mrp family chromosome partitioning ATPase
MRDLLSEATKDYEFVVLDSPPLLNVADGRILATLVDGAVLTVKGGETARDLARRAQDHIRDVGGNLIGVVLNDLDVRTGDYYYYRYDYYGRSREEA